MKAITDKIIDSLKSKHESSGNIPNAEGFRSGLEWAIGNIESIEASADFEETARVMIKHLNLRNDLYHPHHTVIIDNVNAQLLVGKKSTGLIMDYVQD